MDSARVKRCPLCHSGPGWQGQTNKHPERQQRAGSEQPRLVRPAETQPLSRRATTVVASFVATWQPWLACDAGF